VFRHISSFFVVYQKLYVVSDSETNRLSPKPTL
jgi:hypothetical protein